MNSEHLDILPEGAVVPWTGSMEDIPLGWRLCDGERKTPNLKEQFITSATQPPSNLINYDFFYIKYNPLFQDYFKNDRNGWKSHSASNVVQTLDNDALLLKYNQSGFGLSKCFNINETDGYYIEAVVEGISANASFGIAFGMNASKNKYYTFGIYPNSSTYGIYSVFSSYSQIAYAYTNNKEYILKKKYRLKVVVNKPTIRFYINDQEISNMSSNKYPFHGNYFGVYAYGSQTIKIHKLIAENYPNNHKK